MHVCCAPAEGNRGRGIPSRRGHFESDIVKMQSFSTELLHKQTEIINLSCKRQCFSPTRKMISTAAGS